MWLADTSVKRPVFATMVILALVVLMPACAFIPKATLAAVIITSVIFSVEVHMVKPMYNSKSEYNA